MPRSAEQGAGHAAPQPPIVLNVARIGRVEIQPDQRRLLKAGAPVALGGRAFDLLVALAHRAGQAVGRNELMDLVWPGQYVEENNLAVQVNAVRKALGREVVTTVPGRGYMVTGDVELGTAPLRARTEAAVPLIGRDDDLAALGALVAAHRLCTVVGGGGAGKTRLAVALMQAARTSFAHGCGFVDLGAIREPAAVPGAMAVALGAPLRGGGDALAALTQALAPLSLLVVLDNAEHLVEIVATTVSALLAGARGVTLLVTSQVPLKVADEQVYRLSGLALPAPQDSVAAARECGAVALFVARVQALERSFRLTDDNVAAVIALCRSLEGLPLGIELAAARLPMLGLDSLQAALDQRLHVLTQGRRDAPGRQQSLRAALGWSHALLAPAEQAVFRRMAVFVGSASMAMVQAVLADEASALDGWAVMDALDNLVDRSLVRVLPGAPGSEPRYGLLETPLALAREQLVGSGETQVLLGRLAQEVAALFQAAHDRLWHGAGAEVRRQPIDEALADDIDNAQRALDWALANDEVLALRIATTLSRVLGSNRHRERTTLWRRVEPLLAAPPTEVPIPAAVRGHALLQCADGLATNAQLSAARARQAQDLFAPAGESRARYVALCVEARALSRLDDGARLGTVIAEVQALEDASWPPALRLMGAAAMFQWCHQQHDDVAERRWLHETAALMRAAGRSDTVPQVNLIGAERRAGRHAVAIEIGQRLVERLEGTRQQLELAHVRINLSQALIEAGALSAARDVVRANWPIVRQFDLLPHWADNAALLAAKEGRAVAALQLQGYADAAYAALGSRRDGPQAAPLTAAEQGARAALAASHGEADLAAFKTQGVAMSDDELLRLTFECRPG